MRLFFSFLFVFQLTLMILCAIKIVIYLLFVISVGIFKRFSNRDNLSVYGVIENTPSIQLEHRVQYTIPNYHVDTDDDSDDYETDYDSEDDIDISTSEIPHDETDKVHGNYYIGIAVLLREGIYLLNSSISRRSFFAFDYSRVLEYTYRISIILNAPNTQIQIIRLNIHVDGTYEAHIKTHWIRLVQRRWKYVYAERARIVRARGNVQHQEYFRTHGKYMTGYRNLPTLRGMLSDIPRIQKVPT